MLRLEYDLGCAAHWPVGTLPESGNGSLGTGTGRVAVVPAEDDLYWHLHDVPAQERQ